jgi:hypothetical protein
VNVVIQNFSGAAHVQHLADSRMKTDELRVWKWYSVLCLIAPCQRGHRRIAKGDLIFQPNINRSEGFSLPYPGIGLPLYTDDTMSESVHLHDQPNYLYGNKTPPEIVEELVCSGFQSDAVLGAINASIQALYHLVRQGTIMSEDIPGGD